MSPTNGFALIWAGLAGSLALAVAIAMWLVHARRSAPRAAVGTQLMCVMLALVAFFATGFAFALGGVRGDNGAFGVVTTLGREWSPGGPGRGLLGLSGFFLSDVTADPAAAGLFMVQAGLLLIAAVIAIVPWVGEAPRLTAVVFSLLFGGLLYPAFANWVWGGGWLAGLGAASGLGHGAIDFAGSGVVNAAAGLAALGGLAALPRRAPMNESDASANTLLAGLGLAALGWIGLIALNAFALANGGPVVAAANPLIAFACATSAGLLYTWFAAGEPDATVGVASGLAGLAAVVGGAPFYPAWTAAIVGAVAGLLAPLFGYLVQRWLPRGLAVTLAGAHAAGGLWGLLATGIFADGSFGAGINGVGERIYQGNAGQGVTGLWPAAALPGDPGQLKAQVIAGLVVAAFAVVTWVIVRSGVRLSRAARHEPEPAPPAQES